MTSWLSEGDIMAKSTPSVAERKPQAKKPRPDFPLYPHKTGRWAKKVQGRTEYFGRVADDPEGTRLQLRGMAGSICESPLPSLGKKTPQPKATTKLSEDGAPSACKIHEVRESSPQEKQAARRRITPANGAKVSGIGR